MTLRLLTIWEVVVVKTAAAQHHGTKPAAPQPEAHSEAHQRRHSTTAPQHSKQHGEQTAALAK